MTLLFTDIVESTQHVMRLGDARWDALLSSYRVAIRSELDACGGLEVDTAGDGFFAVFRSSDHALTCARALNDRVARLGLQCRTGVHSGTCQTGGEKPTGLNVHVAARVMACAAPGEVLLSDSVCRSLSSQATVATGAHTLKGLPGDWPLHALC
jgi:class 3 adenylate cyclase